MSSQSANSSTRLDSSCCATCKADVEISRNTIRGIPDDLYDHLIRHNRYPDEANVYEKEWEAARIRLDGMKATISLLQAEKERLEGIVGKYKQVLHPVRKAPIDVLQHLFTVCVDEDVGHADLENSLVPTQLPWVLGQISRNWRNIALSTPHLWDKVSLEIQQGDTQRNSSNAHRLGLQLHRSQNVPLHVLLSGGQITSDILIHDHPLLVLICAFSQRWQSLHLKGDPQSLRRLSLTRGLLPQLEKLTIEWNEWNEWNVNQPVDATNYFEFAPRLKTICLHTFTSHTLPWHQIQHFYFNRPESAVPGPTRPGSPTDSGKLWAVIKKLASAKVFDIYFDSGFEDNHMRSTLSMSATIETRVTTLILDNYGPTVIPQFLERIFTPRLSHLQITNYFDGWSELFSLLKRSKCKLAVLMIPFAIFPSTEALNQALSAVPDLKILEIGCWEEEEGADNSHISAFSPPVVPNLERLTILDLLGSPCDDSTVVDMLVHRWNHGAGRLRFVSLDRRIADESSREKLDVLIAQGLTIVEEDG